MGKFVECVPNFSEGRDAAKIGAIVKAAAAVPGVLVLDVEKDVDHNRTVLTFIAPLETAVEGMFQAAKKAAELIDLNHHKGEHPRMGALDVAPFIPIMDTPVEECVRLAGGLGERIGRELNIPVYLYDLAARREDRKDLAKVRKGQFEGLKEDIGRNPDRIPDFGPNKIHPTAGAVAVGARRQIVNFNVNLDTTDMEFSKGLAKKIRASGGGLPNLRAKEIFLESKKQVQISTVLTDYHTTSIKRALDEIEKEIKPRNISITGTELIGLTTHEALINYAIETLKVKDFNPEVQVLETKLLKLLGTWQNGANLFIDALANTEPTPGGGSAAGISGAMGCALGAMAVGISLRSKKLEEAKKPALKALGEKLNVLKTALQNCVSEDAASYDAFVAAMKLPKDDPARKDGMQKALEYAAQVPLKTARLAAEALAAIEYKDGISAHVMSDYKSARYQLEAAVRCAAENVFINAESIEDKVFAEKAIKEVKKYIALTETEKV
ncbi:MAG: glutamate formimidoyltransferase [Elusimicrobia bacterium RIFOXYA12_FULL_51_18]|nr:MAG: glutamate formimidoyltransferase [Elusimicrobia bacterium RIFOXYA12_FULL_51_18]OGS28852.1 MAG: glutamate formimidoyltransferase [Elusimicrobia bacterium RIFOXYA2_FULL_53_38]